MNWTWPYRSKYWNILNNAIGEELKKTFGDYIKEFIFGTLQYTGTCAATLTTPGPIYAQSVPTAVKQVETKQMKIDGFKDRVRARLPSSWRRAPGLDSFLLGVEDAVKKGMKDVWLESKFSGDVLISIGAAVTGYGVGTSSNSGKIE